MRDTTKPIAFGGCMPEEAVSPECVRPCRSITWKGRDRKRELNSLGTVVENRQEVHSSARNGAVHRSVASAGPFLGPHPHVYFDRFEAECHQWCILPGWRWARIP